MCHTVSYLSAEIFYSFLFNVAQLAYSLYCRPHQSLKTRTLDVVYLRVLTLYLDNVMPLC